jgi:hypothetical protein
VTEYLRDYLKRTGGDAERGAMTVIKTRDGRWWYAGEDGSCWRVYIFVEDTICLQRVEQPGDFYESAVAFGNFQNQLKDYPAWTLHETIPNFHNTVSRYEAFEKAVQEDRAGRAASVQAEIAFIQARKDDCAFLMNLLWEGKLPLRVTHNDTKLNNVMFDCETGEGICVVDLDTVMPGLALYDFGDSIRFGASTAAEDEPDLDKVHFSPEYFEAYTDGFLSTAGRALTDNEIKYLPFSSKLMTLECGMRFLGDYINGDTYFKTDYPEHNLVRARTQLRLVSEMEEKMQEMTDIVTRICSKYGI